MLQHSIETNIDRFLNVLFYAAPIKMTEYEEVHKEILFDESENLQTA